MSAAGGPAATAVLAAVSTWSVQPERCYSAVPACQRQARSVRSRHARQHGAHLVRLPEDWAPGRGSSAAIHAPAPCGAYPLTLLQPCMPCSSSGSHQHHSQHPSGGLHPTLAQCAHPDMKLLPRCIPGGACYLEDGPTCVTGCSQASCRPGPLMRQPARHAVPAAK